MTKLRINLGDNSYPVFIGEGLLSKLGEILGMYDLNHQLIILTDANVYKLYGESIEGVLQSVNSDVLCYKILAGEKSKNFSTVKKIIDYLLENSCDRNAVLLAFGGGVVGDVAGFTASIYKRGIRYLQIPTTLLAQVDASIGGKTGVNHALGKNLIGTFYHPELVWMDLALLKSLPRREVICGLAEIIKYGVIRDPDLFQQIEDGLDLLIKNGQESNTELLESIIKRCCEIKAEIVAQDERESGLRMILNFGHTIGHALETASNFKRISHGEAVLLGMLAESKMAWESNLLSQQEFSRIESLISRFELKTKVEQLDYTTLHNIMQNDKKSFAGTQRFVLPESIGKVCVVENVKPGLIQSGLDYLSAI